MDLVASDSRGIYLNTHASKCNIGVTAAEFSSGGVVGELTPQSRVLPEEMIFRLASPTFF